MLIDEADAFCSAGAGVDFADASYSDSAAYSFWRNPGYYFSDSPVRSTCFNCFTWEQDHQVCPSGEYCLKISAIVQFYNPNVIGPITTLPIYLTIHKPTYQLSTSTVNEGGTTSPAPGTYTYDIGSVVTVTAIVTNPTLYEFDCWIVDNTYYVYDNPITVTMNSNHNVKAQFKGNGHGSCPTLFVWNGTDYAEEGILNIHAESDITVQHQIQNVLALNQGIYKLQLRELDNYTSHIDQVKLYAVDSQGEWHLCPLLYAEHSELGIVTWKLWLDDENRIDLTPTQMVSPRFLPSIPYSQTAYFIFEINGYNPKGGRG
jgi:hypothetical protein